MGPSPRLSALTLIAGAAASVIVLVLLYLTGALRPGGDASDLQFLLEPDTFPAHALQEVHEGKVAPRRVPGQGTATAYAEARTSSHAYYLLSGPLPGQVTLYRARLAAPDEGLEQLTQSETRKLALSVHEVTGVAAYTSAGKVIVLDFGERVETALGEGRHPTVLADGTSVLFERGGALVMSDLTGQAQELLRLPQGAVFAVSRETAEVAVYDPARGEVARYFITDSELTSAGTAPAPGTEELFYARGGLYAASMDGDTLRVRAVAGEDQGTVSAPGLSLDGYRIVPL